jgi:hypothetical protein
VSRTCGVDAVVAATGAARVPLRRGCPRPTARRGGHTGAGVRGRTARVSGAHGAGVVSPTRRVGASHAIWADPRPARAIRVCSVRRFRTGRSAWIPDRAEYPPDGYLAGGRARCRGHSGAGARPTARVPRPHGAGVVAHTRRVGASHATWADSPQGGAIRGCSVRRFRSGPLAWIPDRAEYPPGGYLADARVRSGCRARASGIRDQKVALPEIA